ncbi:MAG: hypothetical protein ACK4ZJ_16945, partial [Allorhizobium sp.]
GVPAPARGGNENAPRRGKSRQLLAGTSVTLPARSSASRLSHRLPADPQALPALLPDGVRVQYTAGPEAREAHRRVAGLVQQHVQRLLDSVLAR